MALTEKKQVDTLQFGVSTNATTKNIKFNNNSASPTLGVDTSDRLVSTSNSFLLGDGTGGTKTIQASTGAASPPKIQWNNSLSQWQFSNNGTSFQNFGSGSGGSKNYLSAYTPSTSSGVANTGNGNFEFGATTGWSLCNTTLSSKIPSATAAAGTPFSSSAGGTAASVNLSFATVSSGQLAQAYSGNLASTAASVAGDMLISDAFYIDTEDQAKSLQIKFYYKVNTGASNLNFSGSSSNTWAVYIYDVTAGAWIQPAGVYNLVQNSGTGICTATFQTTASSTRYQLALVNITASAGAYSLYVDDFSVGPQPTSIAPAMSDWQSYSMVITGTTTNPTLGTNTSKSYWRRVGDSVEILYQISQTASGTAGSGTYLFSLPPGLSIDTTKITTTSAASGLNGSVVGTSYFGTTTSGNTQIASPGSVIIYDSTHLALAQIGTVSIDSATVYGTSWAQNFGSNPVYLAFHATVPISGWSSNAVSSADSDQRIVAARYTSTSTGTVSTSAAVVYGTQVYDTHAAMNAATGVYTAPVSGIYDVSGSFIISSGTPTIRIYKNGSYYSQGRAGGSLQITNIQDSVFLNAGDTVEMRADASYTLANNAQAAYFDVSRRSGPAVIQATDSVVAQYYTAAGQSIATGSTTIVNFGSKTIDTTNSVTTGASWKFTAPVSGKYLVSTVCHFASASFTATNNINFFIYKNGSEYTRYYYNVVATGTYAIPLVLTATVDMVAGDYIDARLYQDTGGARLMASFANSINFINIQRIGN